MSKCVQVIPAKNFSLYIMNFNIDTNEIEIKDSRKINESIIDTVVVKDDICYTVDYNFHLSYLHSFIIHNKV